MHKTLRAQDIAGKFVSCCRALPAIAAAAVAANGTTPRRLNWDAFIEQLELQAQEQHLDTWDQGRYVLQIAHLAATLDFDDARFKQARREYRDDHPLYPEFQQLMHTRDVQVSLITFEPGESLPHHDHPHMTGVTACAVGELDVTSYDFVENNERNCVLRKIGCGILLPGATSTLTEKRGNVRAVAAHAFTEIIDIFTPPYNGARIASTRWFRVDPVAMDSGRSLYLAHRM